MMRPEQKAAEAAEQSRESVVIVDKSKVSCRPWVASSKAKMDGVRGVVRSKCGVPKRNQPDKGASY